MSFPIIQQPPRDSVDEYSHHENSTKATIANSRINNQHKLIFIWKKRKIWEVEDFRTSEVDLQIFNFDTDNDNYIIKIIKNKKETETFQYEKWEWDFKNTADYESNTIFKNHSKNKIDFKIQEGDIVVLLFDDFYDFWYTGNQIITNLQRENRGLFFNNPNTTVCPNCN